MLVENRKKILKEFTVVINRNSLENRSNTPDFILAEYLVCCLEAWDKGVRDRDDWYGKQVPILKRTNIKP